MKPNHELDFCPMLNELLSKQEVMGPSGGKFITSSLSTPNNLIVLRNTLMYFKPQNTLEIGLCLGGSCLAITATHRDLGHVASKQHVAIDPYQSQHWEDVGITNIRRAGLQAYLDLRQSPSCLELPKLIEKSYAFDFIYVDGSHLFEDVFIDFYFSDMLLRNEGIILFDDSTNPHVHKVISFILSNLRAEYYPFDLMKFRSPSSQTIKYKLAKLLGKAQLTGFRKIKSGKRSWDAIFSNF